MISVITAKDEAETIGGLVYALSEYGRVIVVNDGSRDETERLATRAGATIICHEKSQGIAASLMEAWQLALGMGADRVLQIDAGGSHEVGDASGLLQPSADIVVGSRFCKDALYIGGYRKYFSRLYAALCNWASGKYVVSDWTSGYRVFSRHALEVLLEAPEYWTGGHAWQAEIIHRANKRGLTVAEAPIVYMAGRSSMKAKDIDAALLVLLKVLNYG